MDLKTIILEQLKSEGELTKRAIGAVPTGKNDWKPHPKSMPMGQLAQMVATMISWIALMVNQDELDIKPKDGGGSRKALDSSEAMLKALDQAMADSEKAVSGTTDEHLETPWKLLEGGKVVMEMSRFQWMLENFGHLSHHRGQLTVYLRMNDVKVPAIYGPSADDHRF